MSGSLAYLPLLGLMSLFIICAAIRKPSDPTVRLIVYWLRIGVLIRYEIWRLFFTLPPFALSAGAFAAYGLMVMELYLAYLGILAAPRLTHRTYRSKEADEHRDWYGASPPRVAVLIPTYNETEDIVFRTIVGATSIIYPNYEVWVLDDGKRDWLRDLCVRFGVNYRQRENNIGYKSGNLNEAIAFLSKAPVPPEFVAVFDADFVPRKNFLQRVLPLLHDPKVGLAQTPQFFFNPDPFQQAFQSKEMWPDDMRAYLEEAQPYADAYGMASCVGTSFVARCSALEAIGGFATESVADDTLTSIKLRGAGFKTVYLDECLSSGLATEGLREYLGQRGRWCLGNIQITFSAWGPAQRLRGWRRVQALALDFGWPIGVLVNWAWYILPILFFFTGYALVVADTEEAISYIMPLFVFRFLDVWMHRGVVMPILSDAVSMVSGFAVVPAFLQGVRERVIRGFRVTEKGRLRGQYTIYWRLLVPFVVLIVLTLAGLALSLTRHSPVQSIELGGLRVWIYIFAFEKLLILFVAACVCVERPRHRTCERFQADLPAAVKVGGARLIGVAEDLSETGCRVAVGRALVVGTACHLELEGVGSFAAEVVRNTSSKSVGLKLCVSETERAELVRSIYCTDRFFHPPRAWTFGRAMRPILRALAGLS